MLYMVMVFTKMVKLKFHEFYESLQYHLDTYFYQKEVDIKVSEIKLKIKLQNDNANLKRHLSCIYIYGFF